MRRAPPPPQLLPLLSLLAVAAAPVHAQLQGRGAEAAANANTNAPTVRFVPRLDVSETATNNVNLSTTGQSDLITRISPGLYASSQGGRVRGFVDYSLSGLLYAQGSRPNQLLNALRADGTAEVLENRGFVDASASISQQAINPLGTQSLDPQVGRANQTEVRTWQLAPRLEGRLSPNVQWTARALHSSSTSSSTAASDSTTSTASFDLGNGEQRTRLGWSMQASRTQRSFSLGRTTDDDILRGVLDYRVSPDFSVGAIGGYESTDIATVTKEGRATYGLRLNWAPSARMQLRSELERRFFGNAHSVDFSYRWPRAALSFQDTRNLTTGVGQLTPLTSNALAGLTGMTPAEAAADPQRFTDELRKQSGVIYNPSSGIPSFLSSGVTLARSQQLSLTWLGQRDALTLTAQQSFSERLDNFPAGNDAFSLNGAIRQRGYTLTLAHRLTPLSNLSLSLTQTRTTGSNSTFTGLRSVSMQWSTALGPRGSFSLQGRQVHSTSTAQPYDESALIGTLGMTF